MTIELWKVSKVDLDRNKMDPNIINKCLSEVPYEIRNAIEPLHTDKAWAIYIVLLKNEELRFTDIKNAFNVDSSGDIDKYLKLLSEAGLIEKYTKSLKDMGK